ncbi:hypothetical protein D3C76_1257080 [compost metagenome]
MVEVIQVLTNTVLDLVFACHLERLERRANRRGDRNNSFAELDRILGHEPAGSVADSLWAAIGVLKVEYLAMTVPIDETCHHGHIGTGKTVDRLPIITNRKQMAVWFLYQGPAQARSCARSILVFVSHHWLVRGRIAALQMLGSQVDHVLEIDSSISL